MRRLKKEERVEAQENIEASMNHLREVIEKPERIEHVSDNALLIPVKVEKRLTISPKPSLPSPSTLSLIYRPRGR